MLKSLSPNCILVSPRFLPRPSSNCRAARFVRPLPSCSPGRFLGLPPLAKLRGRLPSFLFLVPAPRHRAGRHAAGIPALLSDISDSSDNSDCELLLAHENLDRRAGEIPVLADLVL